MNVSVNQIEIATREIEKRHPSFSQSIMAGGQIARDAIMQVQEAMLAKIDVGELTEEMPNINEHYKHTFTHGMYSREMNVPKGIVMIGKIHKHPCLNFIQYGRIVVFSEDGIKEVIGPCYFPSGAGIKRIGIFLEDTKWITIHNTKATTVEDAEIDCVVDTYQEYDDFITATREMDRDLNAAMNIEQMGLSTRSIIKVPKKTNIGPTGGQAAGSLDPRLLTQISNTTTINLLPEIIRETP